MSEERRRVTAKSGGVSKTKQSDAMQSDINSILSKYVNQGFMIGNNAPPEVRGFLHRFKLS